MVKEIGFLLFTTGVIFGGRGMFKRWLHRQRMRRNDRYKQKLRNYILTAEMITIISSALFLI